MKLAIMSDRPTPFGVVPDTFETSPCLLIWDTEKSGGVAAAYEGGGSEAYIAAMKEHDCEAVVCGPHIGKAAFDDIAGACITRYEGAGKKVCDAVRGAFYGSLELIREYEGGPGCRSGRGDCGDGHCEGN